MRIRPCETSKLYARVTDNQDADDDLPQAASDAEPASFLRHILSQRDSKIADGLTDPNLMLSGLLTNLGASAFWIMLLVPVCEAGALLPQLPTAPIIAGARVRKWFWPGWLCARVLCGGRRGRCFDAGRSGCRHRDCRAVGYRLLCCSD